MITSEEAEPLVIVTMSVCKVVSAKRIIEVVRSLEDFTSIIGITPVKAFIALDLASSLIANPLFITTFSSALVTNASASISTLPEVSVCSFSTSTAIALK
ncbi:MAG: Uncharacterised protein [Porticoccaceae bacterium UBA1117]|nr:MAG: Uncharacterised protein [Porticoccaceae bacterium UBA1117]